MSGNTLPYIMYAVVIFLAIAITVFACVRWIYVKTNWKRVVARIETTRLVTVAEDGDYLKVDVAYIFDDVLYRGSITSFDSDNDVVGRTITVLVNPQRPERFNRDRDFFFQKTSLAKWLGNKFVPNHHREPS